MIGEWLQGTGESRILAHRILVKKSCFERSSARSQERWKELLAWIFKKRALKKERWIWFCTMLLTVQLCCKVYFCGKLLLHYLRGKSQGL